MPPTPRTAPSTITLVRPVAGSSVMCCAASISCAVLGSALNANGASTCCKVSEVYTVLGDGEIEEGQVWEAAMFAGARKLDNLVLIVDNNGLQIDGPTSEVMPTDPVDAKMRDFGFRTVTIDGHDFAQIEDAFQYFHTQTGAPTAVLMNTTKGKGVSYMENQVGWHGKAPNAEQTAQALSELEG